MALQIVTGVVANQLMVKEKVFTYDNRQRDLKIIVLQAQSNTFTTGQNN